MKAKIFAKLKQEYSPLGLGDEYLMSKAESLAATGLVTDDNIDAVVACQRKELEGLQKANDKRVTDALEKERKKHEEEETRRKAEEEADKKRKAEEEANKGQNPPAPGIAPGYDELKKTLDDIIKSNKEADAKNAELIKALTDSKTELENKVKTLTDENAAAKAAAAAEARNAMILAKAKELGVPDWRIKEGFKLAEDASEETIVETLTTVANNINTNLLPGTRQIFPISGNEPTQEDFKTMAASIVK